MSGESAVSKKRKSSVDQKVPIPKPYQFDKAEEIVSSYLDIVRSFTFADYKEWFAKYTSEDCSFMMLRLQEHSLYPVSVYKEVTGRASCCSFIYTRMMTVPDGDFQIKLNNSHPCFTDSNALCILYCDYSAVGKKVFETEVIEDEKDVEGEDQHQFDMELAVASLNQLAQGQIMNEVSMQDDSDCESHSTRSTNSHSTPTSSFDVETKYKKSGADNVVASFSSQSLSSTSSVRLSQDNFRDSSSHIIRGIENQNAPSPRIGHPIRSSLDVSTDFAAFHEVLLERSQQQPPPVQPSSCTSIFTAAPLAVTPTGDAYSLDTERVTRSEIGFDRPLRPSRESVADPTKEPSFHATSATTETQRRTLFRRKTVRCVDRMPIFVSRPGATFRLGERILSDGVNFRLTGRIEFYINRQREVYRIRYLMN